MHVTEDDDCTNGPIDVSSAAAARARSPASPGDAIGSAAPVATGDPPADAKARRRMRSAPWVCGCSADLH